jgi:actin-related protein
MADFTLQEGDPRFTNLPLIPYELPDGTQVDVGIERFLLPELFMDPSPINNANPDLVNLFASSAESAEETAAAVFSTETAYASTSLPALIRDSVIRSDAEMQTMLLANMVLTGGSSSFEGMSERIRTEVEKLVHSAAPGWRVKLMSGGAGERSLCPWLGGSILGSLGSFHEVWVSRAEYEEFGPAIVDRKCP